MTGITDPTEEYFKDGLWGWDGTQWRKLGLLFGYYDRLAGQVSTTDAAAGANTLTGDTVPAGEIYVVQMVAAIDSNSDTTRVYIRVYGGVVMMPLADEYSVTAGHWVTSTTNMVMKSGDYLDCIFYGCTAGDDLYLRWWGYKMKVT